MRSKAFNLHHEIDMQKANRRATNQKHTNQIFRHFMKFQFSNLKKLKNLKNCFSIKKLFFDNSKLSENLSKVSSLRNESQQKRKKFREENVCVEKLKRIGE